MSQPAPVAATPIQAQQKAAPVGASHSGLLQRKCACGQHTVAGGECEECRKKREGMLQRAAINAAPTNGVPPIVHDVLSSPGQPLDAGTRAFMEPRFGFDFSRVRVHTDARAAGSAQAVNALAYTVGHNVVFGTGQYAPGTNEGRRLLAHELTHVVQQQNISTSLQTQLRVGPAQDAAEVEADHLARHIVDRVPAATMPSIQAASAQNGPVLRRAPKDFSTPQRVGADEARAASLPAQTRGKDQVKVHVIRSFLPCPCRNVADTRSGIFYNPDLGNLAIAYRHCRGGTTVDVYGQLQSNAQSFLQGQSPQQSPQGTATIGIDINVVGRRDAGGRLILEAVGTNEGRQGVGGRAQVVFQGGKWRVFVTSDFLHNLGSTGSQSENQLDLKLGGQIGTVTAQVEVSDILSSRTTARGTVCIPLGGTNICPYVEGGQGRGVTGGLKIDIPLGGPTVRPERCFQCFCPPPVRKYECMEDVLPREEEVTKQVEQEQTPEYRYYFRLDRTDPNKEFLAQSEANLSLIASEVQQGAEVVSITGYASPEYIKPEATEAHNQGLSLRRGQRVRELLRARIGGNKPLPEPVGGGELLGRRPEAAPSSRLGDVMRGFAGLKAEDITPFLQGEEIPDKELARQFISLFTRLTEPADRLALFGLAAGDPLAKEVLASIDQFVQSGGKGYRPWERVFQPLRVGVVRLRKIVTVPETETIHHPGSLSTLIDKEQCEKYGRQIEATNGFGPVDPTALVPSADTTGQNKDCETEPGKDELDKGCKYELPSSLRRSATPPAFAPEELK
jgi:hypothetical protein